MEQTNESTYQAATAVAGIIEGHFIKHLAAAKEEGEENLATAPSAKIVEKIIDVAFWASLRREEGNSTRMSIAFVDPVQAGKPLLFEKPLPLSPMVLTKLAPGVERPGVHVGVWHDGNELYIWGTTIKLPNFCFVLDVSEPGLLVVKHRRIQGLGKFTNVAMLKGDQVKVVDESSGYSSCSPALLKSLLGLDSSVLWNNPENVLIQIAVSMRAHKRGGILLVTPAGNSSWKESIVHPLQYPVSPAFSGVADLIRQDSSSVSEIYWQNALRREVENVSGLTAVDGATIVNDHHELLAFGAKIIRANSSTPVEKIIITEPVIGGDPAYVHPSSIGGTRHLSAAQFVHDQHDSIALVASQDGYFTIFSWSATKQMVQAHRVDILLL
ncbi:putative sensor domain DACNV-containing protein [Chitinophaga sp. MM2321]|uniref:putative sensor domain DACNV-containing protein n=1 Tax=Chitinophaga sp. MM2321 TaxID=3137178 RepID=UPI0032D5A4AD